MYKQSECPSRNGTIQWKISVCIIQEMILKRKIFHPYPISIGKQTSKISITMNDDISMTFHSLPS